MCGRIGLPQLTSAQFSAWQRGEFDWDEFYRDSDIQEMLSSWNVKPTQQTEILYSLDRTLISTTARWWFIPHWHSKSIDQWKATTFNARIETAAQKPTFRTAWRSTRCILPVSGYFEWTGDKGAKQPWWITTDTNAPATFLAGLYSQLQDGTRTCTILTRSALPQIEHIHARTPVILSHQEISPWLNNVLDFDASQSLGLSWEGRMKFHKVNPFGIKDDGEGLIKPQTVSLYSP